ncbi:uncharacterized protein LOC127749725 [Frankliniella occidentalis]|uniref:Uncharacterized protein LOC127749725 n=1 Tax=Frankliniella occidentalis TaxID=133901 RepID=A0A9C6U070_FRAOC|nr:uncharacterized protein LOC127749725 [Frankliniella occidentalis]XP_052125081.1 uncharacterized protein LOC127749725 [Frankliniella occidentalis]
MAAARWPLLPLLLLLLLLTAGVSPETFGAPCGGTLVGQDSGVLQTPGFPGPYPVPLRCAWVLDASHRQEPSIALYLTQLYLLSGLTITQYAYYEREDFHMGEQELLAVSEQNALDSRVVVAHSPYLVVRLTAQRLEGNQLRALPHLLTVFGFNITWEARDGSPKPWHACSVADCSLAGACLAASDFKSFGCHCFEGHHGEDCGRGPGCSESNNPCRNGATCRHTGWHPEPRCLCRPGYAGPHCETRLQAGNADCPAPASAPCTDCATGEKSRFTITVRLTGNSTVSGLSRHQLERQVRENGRRC